MPEPVGITPDQEPNQAESNNLYYKARSNCKLKGLSCINQLYSYSRKGSHTEGCHVENVLWALKNTQSREHGVELTSHRLILAVRLQCLDLQWLSKTWESLKFISSLHLKYTYHSNFTDSRDHGDCLLPCSESTAVGESSAAQPLGVWSFAFEYDCLSDVLCFFLLWLQNMLKHKQLCGSEERTAALWKAFEYLVILHSARV